MEEQQQAEQCEITEITAAAEEHPEGEAAVPGQSLEHGESLGHSPGSSSAARTGV